MKTNDLVISITGLERSPSFKVTKHLTKDQEQTLIKIFQAKPYLEREERHQLARLLNITESRISRWYGKRRQLTKQAGLLNKAKGEKHSTKYAVTLKNN